VLEYKRVALALFVLTALQREDGGIHLAMVMGAIAACKWWQTRTLSSVRTELNYVAMGLLVGALAWGFTFAIREFDGGRSQSNWELMYSGRPAFAHLSWQLLSERLGYIFQERIYIWLALYVAAVAVYWTRNIYYLAGVLACVPWFMLNLISVQRMTGHFDAYYPFPFVIALGWPLFAVLLKHGLSATGQQVRQGVIVQLLLVIVGLVMWNSTLSRPEFGPIWGQYGDYSLMEGARHRAKVQRFVDLLESGEGQLGDVRADDGISSLIDGTYQGYLVPHFGSRKKPADTFIYMNRNVKRLGEPYLGFVQRTGLTKNYCMPQTTVCMLTNRKPEQLGAFFEMLEPAEIDPRIFDVRVKRGKREIVIKR
jgi:hypothetical protein